MKRISITVVLIFVCLFNQYVSAQNLDVGKLESFSQTFLQEVFSSNKNVVKYLSEDIEVQSTWGSPARGITFFFDKEQYTYLIHKLPETNPALFENIDVFNFKVLSPTSGKFSVTVDLKATKTRIWIDYSIVYDGNQIKINRIKEFT